MAKVMLVGMKKKEAAQLQRIFGSVKVACDVIPTFEAAFERLITDPPALVVAQNPDTLDPLQGLNRTLHAHAPTTPFLVTLSEPGLPVALGALRSGAYDCLSQPYDRLDVLAAAKRAVLRNGRTLFVSKVAPPKSWSLPLLLSLFFGLFSFILLDRQLDGPPLDTISLGSANLSGIQWEKRSLWVGDWFESSVTHYEAKQGLFKRARNLVAKEMFRLQEGQPILVCNTPEALITIGTDLKIRSHQRSVGLPTMQTASSPGLNPTGLAWDGRNLWTSDGQTHLIYRHGTDLRVLETFKSLVPQPVGLAADGANLWILGGSPLQLACLKQVGSGFVWQGPYAVHNILTEGINPSGLAIGHGRLWMVAGGDPHMLSRSLKALTKNLASWENRPSQGGVK